MIVYNYYVYAYTQCSNSCISLQRSNHMCRAQTISKQGQCPVAPQPLAVLDLRLDWTQESHNSILEFSVSVWCPHAKCDILKLEKFSKVLHIMFLISAVFTDMLLWNHLAISNWSCFIKLLLIPLQLRTRGHPCISFSDTINQNRSIHIPFYHQ